MNDAIKPGIYGKLPAMGVVLSRRLPKPFIKAWQRWLQTSLSASQSQLGAAWLDIYLTSPIWRFGLNPGICGDSAWAGVLMPSVDKLGRYFPLTLVAPVPPDSLPHLFGAAGCAWFDALEQLALSCLRDGQDVAAFDQDLQAIPPPPIASPPPEANGRFTHSQSIWATTGGEHSGASLSVCEGLPPAAAFADLLSGSWVSPSGEAVAVLDGNAADITDKSAFHAADATVQLSPAPLGWVWRSWGISVVGKRRTLNEDNMILRDDAGLWAVADGMGGHMAGDVASQTIVDALAGLEVSPILAVCADQVEQCLQQVNTQLCRLAEQNDAPGQIIGSTVVALLARGDRCVFQWAGDSRLYRFHAGKLQQLTRDHSLFSDLSLQGLLTPEEKLNPGHCEIITRAVGADEALQLDQGECQAQPGDLFLLCSDGLDKELSHEEIEAVLQQQRLEDIARVLVEQAEERGARDNVTVVVVQATDEAAAT